jgi:YafQ family addiction module toxin component
MYNIVIQPSLAKKFVKIGKRNKKLLKIIFKKICEIIINPYHYKNLRKPLQHIRRVHIDKHFVLTFSIEGKNVVFKDFDHHDKIYI